MTALALRAFAVLTLIFLISQYLVEIAVAALAIATVASLLTLARRRARRAADARYRERTSALIETATPRRRRNPPSPRRPRTNRRYQQ